MNKEDVFREAHLLVSSDMARKYFDEKGLKIEKITKKQYEELINMINREIYPLLTDKSYNMVQRLEMHKRIKRDRDCVYLLVNGSYFKKRDAITFYADRRIIFCSWASGCNRIPFIRGFVNWCDWMVKK